MRWLTAVSHFSNALTVAVQAIGEEQVSLASRLKMDPSQFNKYCNGRARVGPAVLDKLLSAFPSDLHASLIRAYLLDQIPTDYRQQVEIRERHHPLQVNEAEAEALGNLPPKVRHALYLIGERCHERPVHDLVVNLARLLGGK